jgi:hypothetical protein
VRLPAAHREVLPGVLLGLFDEVFRQRRDGPYDPYQPAPVRHAAYSANLLLLIVLISSDVTTGQLYLGSASQVDQWRRTALPWRS